MAFSKLPFLILNTVAGRAVLTPPNPTPQGDDQAKFAINPSERERLPGVLLYIGTLAKASLVIQPNFHC